MKIKLLATIVLALLASASPCFAQSSKVGLVDTNAFSDPQNGIARLARTVNLVESEFAPRRAALVEMHQRLEKQRQEFAFAGPIPTDPRPMTPERRKQSREKAELMQREFEQEQAEIERDYSNRLNEVAAPIYEDILRSLKAFAVARGITILINAGKLSCPIGCDVESAADLNITRAFIAEYNRQHP